MVPSLFRCPICARKVPRHAPSAPFCSLRCRYVDLGRWFDGEYRVARDLFPREGWEDDDASAEDDLDRPA